MQVEFVPQQPKERAEFLGKHSGVGCGLWFPVAYDYFLLKLLFRRCNGENVQQQMCLLVTPFQFRTNAVQFEVMLVRHRPLGHCPGGGRHLAQWMRHQLVWSPFWWGHRNVGLAR